MIFYPSPHLTLPKQTLISGSTLLQPNSTRSPRIFGLHQESQQQHQNQSQPATECHVETWSPLPIGSLKLNVDGAISSHRGKLGIGAIVRDSIGQVVAARASSREGRCYRKWLKVEVDCKNLVTDLLSHKHILSSYGALIDSIRQVLSSFPTVSLLHVRRQGNKGAHNLAQMALRLDNTWC
ncbi:hypothetical protein G4B88_014457 [Cannabis sativa]|uniref:RNase H type-1 domain-containing protein n=1 Tax=Cannabis sativa TaxID=3483 RepID=A0A7J6IAB2_CANSA|nr:hypothetical protein G4B88_014457 [Cannabis sativa]